MRNKNLIQQGWQSFLRGLANDAKLKFVIGDNVGPATNGKCIWLPALPVDLKHDDLVLFKGNALHEVGHIRHSNIAYFQAFAAKHGKFGQFLLNALDDVFMEGRMASWKQMAARYLRESTMVLVERGCYRDGSASLGEAVGCYCLSYLTAKRWPELSGVTDKVEANLRKHLAQHADMVIPQLKSLLDAEFPAVRSTEHGGELALKVMDLLRQLSEQDQNQDQDDSKDDSGKSEADQESSQSESESESDDDEGEEGKGSGDSSDQEEQDGGDSSDGEGDETGSDESQGGGDAEPKSNDGAESEGNEGDEAGDSESNAGDKSASSKGDSGESSEGGDSSEQGTGQGQAGEDASKTQGKSLKSMIDEMLDEDLGDQEVFDKAQAVEGLSEQVRKGQAEDYKGQPMVEQLEIDGVPLAGAAKDFVDGMPVVEGDKLMADTIKQVVGRKAGVMANRLRALLVNREETETYTARNGRLSDKSLYRIGLDDTRIFEKSEESVEETAAVSITADLSGSTQFIRNGTSIAEQIRVALTMLENVLHEIGTPREILGFAPESGELNCVVRTFGDNHRVALDRIAGLHKLVGGGHTPIGAAVLQAGTRLMAHDAQRKLMFVVTDGTPSDMPNAIQMTNYVARSGVEVIYLVIGPSESCTWLANNKFKFVNAANAEELIPALVSKVAEFLA
jgi:cobalamin biosynthesis protein CobT